jgi:hypothetical protein
MSDPKKKKKSQKIAPKEDVQTINVDTFPKSKRERKSEKTGKACLLRVLFCEEATHVVINKIVSMGTNFALFSKDDFGTEVTEDFQTSNVRKVKENPRK